METQSDISCLRRYAANRDAEAFAQLVHRYAGMVFSVARRITGNVQDAQDVAQTCFFELAGQAATLDGSAAAWLHTAATHRALNTLRNRATRAHHERLAAARETQINEPPAWAEIMPHVDQALAELPDDLRLPLLLRYLSDLPQAEVATRLGINQSTVSRRLEAGVAALREKLKAAGVAAPSVALPTLLAQHAMESAPQTLMAALGKLTISGTVPATLSSSLSGSAFGGGGGGGTGAMASGASTVVAKGTAMLGVKVVAAVILTAAVTTVGVVLLPSLQTAVVAAALPAQSPPMTQEARDVVTRLLTENAQGLGDGVTIVTTTRTYGKMPKPGKTKPMMLEVFALQGDSRLYMGFEAGKSSDWGDPTARLPAGFPKLNIEDAIRFADQLPLSDVEVTDGHMWWHHVSDDAKPTLVSSHDDKEVAIDTPVSYWWWHYVTDMTAALRGDPLFSVEILHRPQTPAIVGFRTYQKHWVPGHNDPVLQTLATCWIDTGRNDVPVECDIQNYKPNGAKVGMFTSKMLEYAQLPDGRWYFTCSHDTVANATMDRLLTFYPGKTLDAHWFADPTARFAAGNAAPPTPPPTGSTSVPKAVAAVVAATATAARSAWWWWPWAVAATVFSAAGALLIRQRRHLSSTPPLRGYHGPRGR